MNVFSNYNANESLLNSRDVVVQTILCNTDKFISEAGGYPS